MTLRPALTLVFVLGTLVSTLTQSATADWPQWQGPDRNGLSTETGLRKQWPAGGPPQLWTIATLGGGYGSIAVKGDQIFVQGAKDRQSVVYVLGRTNGRGLWSKAIGPAGTDDRGSGPRGTPTVDGDRIYVLTENGERRDAGVRRQQSVLHVGLRHRRGAAWALGAGRRGEGAADLLHP